MTERTIERAAGVVLEQCPDCRLPHIVFTDASGEAFAEASMGQMALIELVGSLQAALYEHAVEKGEWRDPSPPRFESP